MVLRYLNQETAELSRKKTKLTGAAFSLASAAIVGGCSGVTAVRGSCNWALARELRAARGGWVGGWGIGLLFIALRWNNYDAPLVRDEGEYAYAAQLLKHR